MLPFSITIATTSHKTCSRLSVHRGDMLRNVTIRTRRAKTCFVCMTRCDLSIPRHSIEHLCRGLASKGPSGVSSTSLCHISFQYVNHFRQSDALGRNRDHLILAMLASNRVGKIYLSSPTFWILLFCSVFTNGVFSSRKSYVPNLRNERRQESSGEESAERCRLFMVLATGLIDLNKERERREDNPAPFLCIFFSIFLLA